MTQTLLMPAKLFWMAGPKVAATVALVFVGAVVGVAVGAKYLDGNFDIEDPFDLS